MPATSILPHTTPGQVRSLERQLRQAQQSLDIDSGAIEVFEGLLRQRDVDKELYRGLGLRSLEVGLKIRLLETEVGGKTLEVDRRQLSYVMDVFMSEYIHRQNLHMAILAIEVARAPMRKYTTPATNEGTATGQLLHRGVYPLPPPPLFCTLLRFTTKVSRMDQKEQRAVAHLKERLYKERGALEVRQKTVSIEITT